MLSNVDNILWICLSCLILIGVIIYKDRNSPKVKCAMWNCVSRRGSSCNRKEISLSVSSHNGPSVAVCDNYRCVIPKPKSYPMDCPIQMDCMAKPKLFAGKYISCKACAYFEVFSVTPSWDMPRVEPPKVIYAVRKTTT